MNIKQIDMSIEQLDISKRRSSVRLDFSSKEDAVSALEAMAQSLRDGQSGPLMLFSFPSGDDGMFDSLMIRWGHLNSDASFYGKNEESL